MTAALNGPIGVLIVDDHRMFAESLARLLRDEKDIVVVGVATSGPKAMSMIPTLQPNVILVDYQLPGQDGVSIAAEIKRMDPAVMVVMLTGSMEDRVLVAAIEVGCSGFLTKDRAVAEVADAIRAAAAGEVLIPPALLARLLPQLNRSHRSIGSDLTEREKEVLKMLANGDTNKAIAAEMFLSVNTIRNYVQSVLTKLNSHSKLEAVSTAVRAGIIDYPSAR